MKKTRFIALTLIVALALMGAGYAAWTDYTKVNANITTGYMDVKFTGGSFKADKDKSTHHSTDAEFEWNNKTINWSVRNLYPMKEDGERIEFFIKNDGTIPVKLDGVNLELTGKNSPVWDNLKVRVFIYHRGERLSGQNADSGLLKNIDEILQNRLKNREIKCNETVEINLRYYLDARTAGNDTQGRNIGFNMTMDWKQFNE